MTVFMIQYNTVKKLQQKKRQQLRYKKDPWQHGKKKKEILTNRVTL